MRRAIMIVGALMVVLAIAVLLVVQSSWFENYVKQTIITSAEESTGGKVEIGTFHFYWRHLTAVATDFVIHGTEPAGAAPLLRVARAQLNLRLFTSLHHLWDIAYLGLDRPQANVIVYPDGHTNIPSPRQKSSGSPLETVVDLAIGRFELTNGLIALAAQKYELSVRGNNLRAQLSYNILSQDYRGQISLQPIYVVPGRNMPLDITVNLPLALSRDRIAVHDASIFSKQSAITLNASIQDLKDPKISAHATGHIALAEVPLSLKVRNGPSVLDLDANARVANHAIEVTSLRLSLGQSNFEASGNLAQGLAFQSRLALGEVASLADGANHPNELVSVTGTVALDSQNTYQVRGNLKDLDLASALRALGQTLLPYDGVLSGPIELRGNLSAGIRGLTAQGKISIAPGRHGIPLSGNLTASYAGLTDDVSIQKSLLTLPHSRLSVDGSMGKQLNVALTTTNLDDLFAVAGGFQT